ncbi:hypothetical protein E3N88_45950 [Mikania micrantha]|uniref:Uncharacterized protein n=1 Tax=Mikania micrantha TaxID=192012 RepID=A0A5N6L7Q7_9ASTR|nr:hypothetical protein E3N88_45950 [Mikania micrantha]
MWWDGGWANRDQGKHFQGNQMLRIKGYGNQRGGMKCLIITRNNISCGLVCGGTMAGRAQFLIYIYHVQCKQSDHFDYHSRYRAPGTFRPTGKSIQPAGSGCDTRHLDPPPDHPLDPPLHQTQLALVRQVEHMVVWRQLKTKG